METLEIIFNFLLDNSLYFLTFISGLFISWANNKTKTKSLKLEAKKYNLDKQKHEEEIEEIQKEKKNKEHQINFLTSIMNLNKMNKIIDAVDDIFKKTKADRFLVLVAINGKSDFNFISVVFEQHKHKSDFIAVATYKEIQIDEAYRQMLKILEYNEFVNLYVEKMQDSLLKEFYNLEGVQFSQLRFLARQKIDNLNDFVVYSSIASHKKGKYNNEENTIIKLNYDSIIIPTFRELTSSKRHNLNWKNTTK